MKKCMDLKKMKKALKVKTHLKAGGNSPRYAAVIPGQGAMNQNHSGG